MMSNIELILSYGIGWAVATILIQGGFILIYFTIKKFLEFINN